MVDDRAGAVLTGRVDVTDDCLLNCRNVVHLLEIPRGQSESDASVL